MRYFKNSEFPEDPDKYAADSLLFNLDRLRAYMGVPVYPSPAKGALARFDEKSKDSQHYAVGRLSTACDIFIDCNPFEAYIKILKSRLFKRIGIYFDTHYKSKPWVMFHVDLKDQDLMWIRNNGKYIYSYTKDFYSELLYLLK